MYNKPAKFWQGAKINTVFICIKAGLIYMQGLKYMLGSAVEWLK